MNIGRNRFEYGYMMDRNTFKQIAEEINCDVCEKIDFKSGIRQEISGEQFNNGIILDVRWKKDVHFILRMNKWSGRCSCDVLRNRERVSGRYLGNKKDEKFLHSLQHLVNEIENGAFDNKKTESEKIAEIIRERNLTSCMNNTKWKEFIKAINEEMPVMIPCDYLTLFGTGPFFTEGFDDEHLGYKLKAIEWVRVKPKFYVSKYKGRLVEDDKELCDFEQEFLCLMDKYSIPYEYDSENEEYIIYGYK